jgi:hypothetical protein
MKDWEKYQNKVAEYFRKLGCNAEVNKTVKGIRSKHKVDVWVVFKHFGIEHRYVVECKDWENPIPKEKVLTLKSIVEDIGADKGILIAESGFQPGAFNSANSTNILLTTLKELYEQTKNDLQTMVLMKLEDKMISLQAAINDLYIMESTGENSGLFYTKSGIEFNECINMTGRLSIIDRGFKELKLNKYPILVGAEFKEEVNKGYFASNIDEFINMVGHLIEEVEKWLSKTKK